MNLKIMIEFSKKLNYDFLIITPADYCKSSMRT